MPKVVEPEVLDAGRLWGSEPHPPQLHGSNGTVPLGLGRREQQRDVQPPDLGVVTQYSRRMAHYGYHAPLAVLGLLQQVGMWSEPRCGAGHSGARSFWQVPRLAIAWNLRGGVP